MAYAIFICLSSSTKQEILDIYGDGAGKFASDSPPEKVTPDMPPNAQTPLFHFERSEEVYQNLLYTTWAATVIDMSPGNGALALAAIRMRIPICIIVKNAVHR